MDSVSEQEKIIDKYLSEGNQDAAVKTLYDLIVACAKKHDFIKAETLRDKLFEVAPMALSEISRSGDIIDEEKSRSIDEGHRKIWSELYSNLTTEEANELYFAMKENVYKEGETIFSTGDNDNKLYFLDSGEVKMVYMKENEEILKILEPGDITGEDTFFYTTALKTVSLIANSEAKLLSLDREIQERWKENFPALEQKLREYCNKSGRISEILLKKGMNRRRNKRKKLTGKVAVQLLNPSGTPSGKQFLGALCDISISGLSFTFKLSNNDVAHKLLGSKIKTQLVVPDGDASKRIEQIGKIVGIGYHVLADHSIHVRFDQPDITIKKLIGN
ncbi:MAG: cyclic nucleotide-binding domain-containing protein [Desulfobacteraceae bacterium]|jgi:CRP-like cAMP-binding protein